MLVRKKQRVSIPPGKWYNPIAIQSLLKFSYLKRIYSAVQLPCSVLYVPYTPRYTNSEKYATKSQERAIKHMIFPGWLGAYGTWTAIVDLLLGSGVLVLHEVGWGRDVIARFALRKGGKC